MKNYKYQPTTIKDYIELYEKALLTVPSYQRKFMCNSGVRTKFKSEIITSALKGNPIGLLHFRELNNNQIEGPVETVYELVDGLQRLTTFMLYVKNTFPIGSGDHKGKYFKDLTDQEQQKILNTPLMVCVYMNYTDAEIIEVFEMINNGTPVHRINKILNNNQLLKTKLSANVEKDPFFRTLKEIGVFTQREINEDKPVLIYLRCMMLLESKKAVGLDYDEVEEFYKALNTNTYLTTAMKYKGEQLLRIYSKEELKEMFKRGGRSTLSNLPIMYHFINNFYGISDEDQRSILDNFTEVSSKMKKDLSGSQPNTIDKTRMRIDLLKHAVVKCYV